MGDLVWSVIAGIAGGLISPLLLAFLQQRVVWRSQKIIEVKKAVFDNAMTAMALFEVDALDHQLQADVPVAGGVRPVVHLRSETKNAIQKSLAEVEAFFNAETYSLFQQVMNSTLSLKSIPNPEHFRARATAIRAMANEIGLDMTAPWWKVW